MKTKVLRSTIHTYKTWELETLLHILKWDEFSQTKRTIINNELKRRRKKNYTDATLDPRVSISKRIAILSTGS
jgi:hypothetical protein